MDRSQLSTLMAQVFAQANRQFGDAVKGHWLHDMDTCPACQRPTKVHSKQGKRSLSLNTYIYRKRGMLIGYILCTKCSATIHRAAKRTPNVQSELHTVIESTLDAAFETHLKGLS